MRRHRNRNKGDILIDLTSLLDVVFIVLLIVICNQQSEISEAKAQKTEYSKLSEQAEVQLQLYADQMEIVDNFYCVISVNARYDSENVTQRYIYILKNGESKEKINMEGNNTEVPLGELRENLKKYIDSNAGKPIILSLNENDEDILYRDEQAIQKIFNELKNDSEYVYLK